MKKSKMPLFAALFALFAAMFALTACAGRDHGFVYRYDADGHWQMCSDCGDTTEKEAHGFGAWETVTPATCTAVGSKKHTCGVCGYEDTEEIPTLAHSYVAKHDETNHWKECSVCHEKTEEAAHGFGEWTTTKEATCTEKGLKKRNCECGYEDTEEIPTLAHSYVLKHDAANHWKECSVCQNKIEVTAHGFGAWETVTPATCTEAGSESRTCVCGQTETQPVSALGHDFGEWTVKSPATHFEKGEEARVCSRGDKTETRDLDVVPHAFGEELFYEASGGAVVSYTVCACGETSERKTVPNAVIATPETAQDVLDRAADGALIYFAAGAYDQPLYLRQNKYASKVKKNHADPEYLEISGLNKTGVYCYYRTVQNLTLYGGENAVFTNKITFGSGHVYGVSGMTYPQNFDAVREVNLQSTNTSYYSYLYVDGLTLKNLKFSGADGRVEIAMQMPETHLNDFTIDRCEFDASSVSPADRGSIAAINMITDVGGNYNNITLKNTKIDGHFQGIHVQNAQNVSFTGNTVRNTTHNAFAVQANDLGFSGGVTIRDNRMERIGDRAIRFGVGKNADIVVEDNIFVEIDDAELLKSQTLDGCRYAFRGNVYGDPGAAIADVTGTGAAFVVARP